MKRCPGVVELEGGTLLPWPVFHDHDVECISDEARAFVDAIWAKRLRLVTPDLTPDARQTPASDGNEGQE